MVGVLSRLGWAVLGFITVWHGLTGARYRSLLMRLRGKPGVPMQLGHRVLIVSVGLFLAVGSVLLALGIVQ
jgi:hypothetical protein